MERHRPSLQADERTMLVAYLDFQRATMLLKAEGLSDQQLAQTTAASSLTLGGLLKHLALVEDHWFRHMLLGEEPAALWRDHDWDADPDWEFESAAQDSGAWLVDLYTNACDASRAAVASLESLDHLSSRPSHRTGEHFSLRWVLLHMIEETARHAGHADLLREAIDGVTGE
jgi:uncharacterized damage-inducible protein DinB